MCAALFVIGLCSSGRWTVTYVYLMEFLTEKNIKGIGPFFNASAGISFVVAALILQFCTKDAINLIYIGAVESLIAIVLCVLLLPESAKWLVG